MSYESDPNFDPAVLDEASKRAYNAAQRVDQPGWELDPTLHKVIQEGDGIRAGYKIEVFFGPGRTDRQSYNALLLLWESGKHLHGGGDGAMYICLDHRPFEKVRSPSVLSALRSKMRNEAHQIAGCGSPIPSTQVQMGLARCPTCGRIINSEHLMGQLPFFGTTAELAELTEILYSKLKHNADVYAKYYKTDIRFLALSKPGSLAEISENAFIYPLRNIIKETSNGASVRDRFTAFFRA